MGYVYKSDHFSCFLKLEIATRDYVGGLKRCAVAWLVFEAVLKKQLCNCSFSFCARRKFYVHQLKMVLPVSQHNDYYPFH